MSFATVIGVLGRLLAIFAVAMLAPALVALAYGEQRSAMVFAGTAGATLFFAVAMVFAMHGTDRPIGRRGNLLLAFVSWPLLAAFGAAPLFMLDAVMTPTDAFFEALSGLTTTGATVMWGLEEQGRAVVFWRSAMQWLGGLATIVVAVSLLPALEVGGMQLFQSVMPYGHHATIEARLRRTTATLGWIYALLTAICAAALWAAGMPGFDAVGHALSTLSTGGFSTRDASIGAYDSPLIELVLMVFMLAGALNFTLYWALLHGRVRAFRDDPEFRPLLTVALAAGVLVIVFLAGQDSIDGVTALRQGAFATVSMLTTTGFVGDLSVFWPSSVFILLLILAFIGGSSGSTSGGVKLMRVGLALRQGRRELARLSHPHGVVRVHYGESAVSEPAMQAVWGLLFLFVTGFAALTIVLSALGLDPEYAVAMALATLTNSGAGLAMIAGPGAGYVLLPDAAKWVLCAGMLLGRLELVAAVALMTPLFWRR